MEVLTRRKSVNPKLPQVSEKVLHQQICNYLKQQYPNVIFFSDPSGMRVSMGLRMELKRKRCQNYKIPDLIILCPNEKYNGLILEIKKSKDEVYKKDGSLKSDKHIDQQLKALIELSRLGYYAWFGFDFYQCQEMIDCYFQNKL